jgi:hypothetical protein
MMFHGYDSCHAARLASKAYHVAHCKACKRTIIIRPFIADVCALAQHRLQEAHAAGPLSQHLLHVLMEPRNQRDAISIFFPHAVNIAR